MITYPNQKVVVIEPFVQIKGQLYFRLQIEAVEKAMRDLTGNEFKLYIYLAKNADNYKFALSPKHISEATGIGLRSCHDAIKTLIEKNYLYVITGNLYGFSREGDSK